GVAVLDPRAIKSNLRPPPVLIEQVYANNLPVEPRGGIIPPNARELRFQYTALSFIAPEKVRFQYQLEGLDDQWVDAETRRIAVYNQLPPGHYQFRVRACNNDGVWNEAGAAFSFSRAPHFYQTAGFYLLFAAVATGAALGFHRNRMKRAHN